MNWRIRCLESKTVALDPEAVKTLVDRLGYLRLSALPRELVLARIVETSDLLDESVRRSVFLDSENLFERGVNAVFRELMPEMKDWGLRVSEMTSTMQDGPLRVQYPPAGLEVSVIENSWLGVTQAVVGVMNQALAKIGCQDHIWFDYGSNDSRLILASDAQMDILVGQRAVRQEAAGSDLSKTPDAGARQRRQ